MDIKEKQLLDTFYSKIIDRNFDEKDIYALLIMLRQHANKKSPVYEFANFIAHRERDKGYIKEYLETTKYKLDNLGKINTILEIRPIFTIKEIEKSFNDVFVKIGKQPTSSDIMNDILLCIIMLLQDIKILDKKGRTFGKLIIGISKTKVFLHGKVKIIVQQNKEIYAIFPALEANNHYIDLPETYTDDKPAIFKSIIEVVNNGKLELKFLGDYKISNEITWGDLMVRILEGWLDVSEEETILCKNKDEIGHKFYLDFAETLIGQLKEFDEKKIRITIEVIEQ